METIEYRDEERKKELPPGPWQDEPDKIQYPDEATGMPCLIVRNAIGALCGYVGVEPGHTFYGIDYSDCSLPGARRPNAKKQAKKEAGLYEGHGWRLVSAPNVPASAIELRASFSKLGRIMNRHERQTCGRDYCDHTPESLLRVHGGITFSGFCQETAPEGRGVCHIPAAGEPKDVFWFGFDCAHYQDYSPGMAHIALLRSPLFDGEQYRDIEYVKEQVKNLAAQLWARQ